jgi:hypothetical protein
MKLQTWVTLLLVLDKATLTPTLSLREREKTGQSPFLGEREKPVNPLSWGRGLG